VSEYVTDAVVLSVSHYGYGYTRRVTLLTEELGCIEARAVGGRRIYSKLGPHLDIGSYSRVRLVFKNQYTITDALENLSFTPRKYGSLFCSRFLSALYLVRSLQTPYIPDYRVWYEIMGYLSREEVEYTILLSLLGYDLRFSVCGVCGSSDVFSFACVDCMFLCNGCNDPFPFGEIVVF
jgi:recombinational DNA repair protein (RecF pathway)